MGTNKRVLAANCVSYAFVIGMAIVVGIAYFVRDFKMLCIAYTIVIGSFVFFFWICPESPRWLMVKNKPEKAYPIFKRIAKSNKKTQLTELESIRPDNFHKRIRLGSIKPIDLDKEANNAAAIIVNDENESTNKVNLKIKKIQPIHILKKVLFFKSKRSRT